MKVLLDLPALSYEGGLMGKIVKYVFKLQEIRWKTLRWAVILAMTFAQISFCERTMAFETHIGKDIAVDVDVTLKYSTAIRVEEQDEALLADVNGDDGNRNFDKGDFINNRFSAIIDIDINHDNIGCFLRPRAFYDFAYDGHNAHDSPETNNNGPLYGGPLSSNDSFTDKTKETHRDQGEILDAYAYGTFDLGGRDLVLRVGKQVVSWGESLFLANSISSAQSHVDATQSNTPGMELKELFLPSGQVYSQLDLREAFTLAGFYQWQWKKNTIDEAGAFFSTSDFLDEAGHRILPIILAPGMAPSIDRGADESADDSGQWGISLRYIAERLNDTEFGFYYINYHEKNPMVIWQPTGGSSSMDWTTSLDPVTGARANAIDASSYHLKYAENVKLYGFSFGTVIGTTNVSGEMTYRKNLPVAVKNPLSLLGFSYKEAEVLQVQISAIHNLGPGPMSLWDGAMLTGEAGFNRVNGLGDADLDKDRFAWGGTLKATFDYFTVLPKLDLKLPVTCKFNPKGISSVTGTFTEKADSLSVGLDFIYAQVYQFGLSYTAFIGSASDNAKADRDFVGFNFKFTF